ncbi:MAG TPA: FecR family protein [Flavisolibacter sp.]|nr:FecR family protein [Flavisolibacter sp.]
MSENRYWQLLAKKLSGEASAEELTELEKLVRDHPELAYSSEHLTDIWQLQTKPADPYDAELAFELHLHKLKASGAGFPDIDPPVTVQEPETSRKRINRRLVLSFALAAALIASYAWYSTTGGSNPPAIARNVSEVSTRLGSRSRLVLPDSTIVYLNAGSRLTYNEQYGISNRATTLSGEAFFDVRESKIPFTIKTASVSIKVLGTAFNVKSYPNEKTTETSLVRGKVEITLEKRSGQKFILRPNEKLVVANEPEPEGSAERTERRSPIVLISELTHLEDNTIAETSWVENKLVFQDESFEDIARRLERWYGVAIRFEHEGLKKERLTGTFTNENIREALAELQLATSFQFTINSNSITITQ